MFHVHTQIYPQDKCTHTHYEYKNIYVYILMHIYINSHTITWCVYVVCMLVWRGGNEREQGFSEEGKKHVRNIPCFQDSSEMQVQFCKKKKEYSFYTIPFVTKGVSFRIFQHRSCILWRRTFLRLVRKPFFVCFSDRGILIKTRYVYSTTLFSLLWNTNIFTKKIPRSRIIGHFLWVFLLGVHVKK